MARSWLVGIGTLMAFLPGASAHAADGEAMALSLAEALEIALVRNYALERTRLDLEESRAQIDQAWGRVWPRVDADASYTRNLAVANPFAGSTAGDLFSGFDAVGWLAFNEDARTDVDPDTNPIPFSDFVSRQMDGRAAAGIPEPDPDENPFFVGNQFSFGLTVRQLLYDGAAFAGIQAANVAEEASTAGITRQMHRVVEDTAVAYYGAQSAKEETLILEKSVARAAAALEETRKRVGQGIQPRFAELSAEVELANLQTQLVRTRNAAEAAVDNVKLVLGIPAETNLRLTDDLPDDPGAFVAPSREDAMAEALTGRPDLLEARKNVELLTLQERVTFSEFLPVVSGVLTVNMTGSVPDDRTVVLTDPDDPFMFSTRENDFFSDSYWFSSASVGVELTWNLFDGFASVAQLEANQVATQRSRSILAELENTVRVEVDASLRDLASAKEQIRSQRRNVERAELNYRHAEARLKEGVSSQLELREASDQLDQSRLSQKQAVHDFLVARVRYQVAVGSPPLPERKEP